MRDAMRGFIENLQELDEIGALGDDELTIYQEISPEAPKEEFELGQIGEEEVLVFEGIGAVKVARTKAAPKKVTLPAVKPRAAKPAAVTKVAPKMPTPKVAKKKAVVQKTATIATQGRRVRIPKTATVGIPTGATITMPGKAPVTTLKAVIARLPAGTVIQTKAPKAKVTLEKPSARAAAKRKVAVVPTIPTPAKPRRVKIPTEGKPLQVTKQKKFVLPQGTKITRRGKTFTTPKKGVVTLPAGTTVQTPAGPPAEKAMITIVQPPAETTITVPAEATLLFGKMKFTIPAGTTIKLPTAAGALTTAPATVRKKGWAWLSYVLTGK